MEMFGVIERAFEMERASGRLTKAVEGWSRNGALGDARTLEDLIQRCRGPVAGSRDQKDSIHVTLCRKACHEPRDEMAGVVLCWLFLPGLSALLRAFSARSNVDQEDLFAELLTGFWEAAARVKPHSRYVARYLLLGARRRARRALRQAERAASAEVSHAVDASATTSIEELSDVSFARALGEGLIDRRQVELLLATRSTIGEVAARYELSLAAAQQARHRARQRLAHWLKDL
ncbi:MAG: hypothetical protein WEB06_08025 [Actinomycetota bacterium]